MRQRERQIDRQRDGQTETDRHTQTERDRDRWRDRQGDRERDRQRQGKTHRERHRQTETERQTGRQTRRQGEGETETDRALTQHVSAPAVPGGRSIVILARRQPLFALEPRRHHLPSSQVTPAPGPASHLEVGSGSLPVFAATRPHMDPDPEHGSAGPRALERPHQPCVLFPVN